MQAPFYNLPRNLGYKVEDRNFSSFRKKKKIKTVITARFLSVLKHRFTLTGKNDIQFPGDGIKLPNPDPNIWSDVWKYLQV